MRPFKVGDVFKGNHSDQVVTVRWVDPKDHFRAVVDYAETTVFAAQFLNHWTLIQEGSSP